ncbi:metallo-hydrolase/oxidoreductase superfamily protein, partial [Tanacetum coccineum]
VLFSDDFRRSFGKLTFSRLKKLVLNILLKLSGGWRPKTCSVDLCCENSSQILKQFKVEGFYVICTIDIIKEVKYVQVLKVWDILALDEIPKLTKRLENIYSAYTDTFISRCPEKMFRGLTDLPEIDCILITQSLDDHCHLNTLKPLSHKLPNVRVIATPNAKTLLDPLFTNVVYLEPGQNYEIQTSNSSYVKVRATDGPVLGPPWQRPENGYIVTSPQGQLSLYYEPHCVYDQEIIGKKKTVIMPDIVITPVIMPKLL